MRGGCKIKKEDITKRIVGAAEKKARKLIRVDLLLQLESMETRGMFFENMIDDYMSFWDMKNGLIHDVKTRGVVDSWRNSDTQYGYKKNDSVSELVRVNGQMLKILHQLNINTDTVVNDGENDDY